MHTNLTSQSGPEDTHAQLYRDSSSDFKIYFWTEILLIIWVSYFVFIMTNLLPQSCSWFRSVKINNKHKKHNPKKLKHL